LAKTEEDEHCKNHPGGCRCYYDALAENCPSSLGHDSQIAMCSCDYSDNTWLSVLSNFIWAFSTSPEQRPMLAQEFSMRLEAGGLLSMDVGYKERVQCGAPLAQVYPGTNFQLDIEELHSFARNLFWPEVRQKLTDVCVPGRVALQLLCLHAELGRKNVQAAVLYASELFKLHELIERCHENGTPWPFPGLATYVRSWKTAEIPEDGSAFDVSKLSWWPDVRKMRGKLPEESDQHYFPCVPLKDKACFPVGTASLHMSCEHCCDPGRGPMGEAACFVGEFTFNRCCRTPGNQGRFY